VRAVDLEIFVLEGVTADDARVFAHDPFAQGFEQREGFDGRARREGLFVGDAGVDDRAHAPRLRVERENRPLAPVEGGVRRAPKRFVELVLARRGGGG
jgi:hypothetical protein